MRRFPLRVAAVSILATASAATGLFAGAVPAASAAPAAQAAANARHAHKHKKVCTTPTAGAVACDSQVQVNDDGVTPDATTSYANGLTPAQLRSAYRIPATGATTTIAVVDAYASPRAQTDLNAYRNRFGLGSTTLTQYTQSGAALTSSNVAHNVGWGQEEMLDLEMASAACPSCKLMYVAASNTSFSSLSAAVNTARAKGAKVISNSYGGSEFSGEASSGSAYTNAAAAHDIVTVSSGDSGYGVQFPAALNSVVAVGGTSLTLDANGNRTSETAWSGAGSGCSAYISKPSWQTDTGCARRTVADVSAVADPNTGVAVYDSYGSSGGANWYVFGGTSVAAPLVGGIYAAVGVPTTSTGAASLYATGASLYDVTSGSNGTCTPAYLCTAGAGYDGPTGLGAPNGTTGF